MNGPLLDRLSLQSSLAVVRVLVHSVFSWQSLFFPLSRYWRVNVISLIFESIILRTHLRSLAKLNFMTKFHCCYWSQTYGKGINWFEDLTVEEVWALDTFKQYVRWYVQSDDTVWRMLCFIRKRPTQHSRYGSLLVDHGIVITERRCSVIFDKICETSRSL